MPALNEIQNQINAYKDRYIFWTKKEIRALPEILDDDERIHAVTSGMRDGTTWLLVCTQRRLIFLHRGMFFGLRQIQMPLDRIQSIDHTSTLGIGAISVWDGASSVGINLVWGPSILPFVRTTEEAMYALRKAQSKPAAASTDIASQIAKLAELKEKGHLTKEEFEAQKKKLFPDSKEMPKNFFKAFQSLLSKEDFKIMDDTYQRACSIVHKSKSRDKNAIQEVIRHIRYCIHEIERLNLSDEQRKEAIERLKNS